MSEVSTTEIDGRIMALTQQRNGAMDHAVILNGKVMAQAKEIEELKETVAALQAKKQKAQPKE